jgi:hypothetical protein
MMWAIYPKFRFSINNMSKITLGIENKLLEILVIKYDGQERPLPPHSTWMQEIDNAKPIEIIRQKNPGDSRRYDGGFFSNRCRVECTLDGDKLRVTERWGQ